MKLLVLGASKGIGLATTKAALDAGIEVRAFARGATSMGLNHPSLEKVIGDATDAASVAQALDGVDAVAHTLGVPLTFETVTKGTNLFSRSTEILIDAMQAQGPRRLIVVTGFGAGRCASRIGPLERLPHRAVLGRIYDDKTVQEELVVNSDLDWTIVRPVILTNGKGRKTYKVMIAPETWRNGLIARADVGHYVVQALGDDQTIRTDPVIAY